MTSLPKAILFDLDDTILNAGHRPQVLLQIAEAFAAELSPLNPAAVADYLEARFAHYWSDPAGHKLARLDIAKARRGVVRDAFAELAGARLAALADPFADRFTATRDAMTELFPTARATILTLREKGVLLALVTNGTALSQRAKIERFALADLFDHIQIEGEHGFGKPEERAYLHAMQALGVTAAETWMVGDHLEWEVAAPQRLGIHAVWYDGFGKGLPLDSEIRPDRTIQRMSELLA